MQSHTSETLLYRHTLHIKRCLHSYGPLQFYSTILDHVSVSAYLLLDLLDLLLAVCEFFSEIRRVVLFPLQVEAEFLGFLRFLHCIFHQPGRVRSQQWNCTLCSRTSLFNLFCAFHKDRTKVIQGGCFSLRTSLHMILHFKETAFCSLLVRHFRQKTDAEQGVVCGL